MYNKHALREVVVGTLHKGNRVIFSEYQKGYGWSLLNVILKNCVSRLENPWLSEE